MVRAAHQLGEPSRERLDLVRGHARGIFDLRDHVADARNETNDAAAKGLGDHLLGDGARRHPRHRLPRAGAAATAVVPAAVLGVVGVVGVAGPVLVRDVGVVAALGILVAHQDRDGRAGGLALEHAGQDLRLVALHALGDDAALTRPAPLEVSPQVLHTEGEARRAAVHDHDVAGAVGLPSRRDAKGLTKAVTGHGHNRSKGPGGGQRN